MKKIEEETLRREINAYRNKAHQAPAIIGQKWSGDHKFQFHFLPSISGLSNNDDTDMSTKLQEYFEYTANIWLSFAPSDLKEKFPRDFRFVVTVPHSFIGELPKELERAPQLEVHIESYSKTGEVAPKPAEAAGKSEETKS